ncbi:universal stress protein [Donghicola sp. XS_ASV15]|uniref:universal stress protein n=1 Tax=Donghicola sp. XS_ASV15 TaxID=3241295 RepID=UPI00351805C2
MTEKIVVAYDGSENAHNAVNFALDVARAKNATLVVVHVLEWSPYSFLTKTEIEERHMRRKEELERADKAIVSPLLQEIQSSGVAVEVMVKYGHISETLLKVVADTGAKQLVIGRTGQSSISTRLFGSVAGTLAQAAPVAVTIVP